MILCYRSFTFFFSLWIPSPTFHYIITLPSKVFITRSSFLFIYSLFPFGRVCFPFALTLVFRQSVISIAIQILISSNQRIVIIAFLRNNFSAITLKCSIEVMLPSSCTACRFSISSMRRSKEAISSSW